MQKLLMLVTLLMALAAWGIAGEEDYQTAMRHNQIRAWSVAQWEVDQ